MQQNIDLMELTDMTQLKALKADQYDVIESCQTKIQIARQNIANITIRINQLQPEGSEPSGQSNELAD